MKFECKTVTPLFMSGADTNKVELRPASFKGMFRFWWRALHGNYSLDDLRKEESDLFGSSDEKFGKSPFSIIVENPDIWDSEYTYRPLPHSDEKKKQFKIPAIKEETEFHFQTSSIENVLNRIKPVIEISFILGGLGKRSRRGFGSVKILKIDNKDYSMPQNPNKLLDNILKLINSVNQGKYKKNGQKIAKSFTTDNKYPYIEEIEIGKEYSSVNEILKAIGQASQDYNCEYTGTPIFPKIINRFASPIYVSVIKCGNKFRPIITTLACCPDPEIPLQGLDKSTQFKGAILV
ncbi:MAG: type III-B CRISPR module RAMP protein Cmr1 [bacterium]